MAKKWSEVISSEGYKALSPADKEAAQSQYFNQVVAPQLAPNEVEEARSQFYGQYPVGSAAAPIAPQSAPAPQGASMVGGIAGAANTGLQEHPNANTTGAQPFPEQAAEMGKGFSRQVAGILPAIANVGVGAINTIGNAVQTTSNAITGETGQYQPLPEAGYGVDPNSALGEYLVPRGVENIGSDIGAAVATMPLTGATYAAEEGAGLATRLGTRLVNNFKTAVPITLSENSQGNLEDVATDLAINTGAGAALETVVPALVRGARRILPEYLGGASRAEQVAQVANPQFAERVYQGGNEEAQDAFRAATTNAAGESTVLPGQALTGRFANAQARDLARGEASYYAPTLAEQQSGVNLERAVSDLDKGMTLQETAGDITGQFKTQANDLYNSSKQAAQDLLDSSNVSRLKMPNTKQIALDRLNAPADKIPLRGSARTIFNDFKNAEINSINGLDNWKRRLSEEAWNLQKAGKNEDARDVRGLLDSLRNEADATIQSINPQAGSLYQQADSYFRESVGDFGTGKKSVLGKVAANPSEAAANRMLVGAGQQAAERATAASEAMQTALASGSLDNAARLSLNFSGAMGDATRAEAIRVGSTGANFSPTKFANRLNQLTPQAEAASKLSGLVGGSDEAAVNSALADAVAMTRETAKDTSRILRPMANIVNRGVGAGVGAIAGSVVPGFGAIAGAYAGERAAQAISRGFLDRLIGTPQQSAKYIDFLSQPENAKAVLDILSREGGVNAPVERIAAAVDALATPATRATLNATQSDTGGYNPQSVPDVEPEQYAQAAQRPESPANAPAPTSFEPKITKLYKALSSAETGGLDNRFIRTKAAESGVSTAYGPAQITGTLAADIYKRHAAEFTAPEREYLRRFIDQANMMKHAAKNDPVYGYGGTGVLGSAEDRKLYAHVARKFLKILVDENGGSLDATVKRWRGNDNDKAYFQKVSNAYRSY